MKFDHIGTTSAQVVGEIQQNNVGIDEANLDFIITILSSNLYSDPIGSTVREIVSNGWDSHIEAGVTEPVIISFNDDLDGNFSIQFKDFGVGLSPERFNKVYKNIGSSTKRDTNNQIGGFGIGKFAPLSYSDMIYIVSIFDGKEYSYVMHKDNNKINIDLINEADTTEKNGVAISIDLKKPTDATLFLNAIGRQLSYFENVLLVNNINQYSDLLNASFSEDLENFNLLVIKRFNSFSLNTENSGRDIDLILGKVRYPLNRNELRFDLGVTVDEALYKKVEERLGGTDKILDFVAPLSINFNIGELAVTPNREQVLYSEEIVGFISQRYLEAIDEFLDYVETISSQDFKNLKDFIKYSKEGSDLMLLENSYGGPGLTYKSPVNRFTYKGTKYSKNTIHRWDIFLNKENYRLTWKDVFSNFAGVVTHNEVFSSKIPKYSNLGENKSLCFMDIFQRIHCNVLFIDKPFSSLNLVDREHIKELKMNTMNNYHDIFLVNIKGYKGIRSIYKLMYKHYHTLQTSYNFSKYEVKIPASLLEESSLEKSRYVHKKLMYEFSILFRSIIKPFLKQLLIYRESELTAKEKEHYRALIKERRVYSDVDYKEAFSLEYATESSSHLTNVKLEKTTYTVGEIVNVRENTRKHKLINFIYFEKNEDNANHVKNLFESFKPFCKKYNIRFCLIAKGKIKLIEQFDNFKTFEEFAMDDKIFRKVATVTYIKAICPELEGYSTIMPVLTEVSPVLAEKYKKILTFVTKNSDLEGYFNDYHHVEKKPRVRQFKKEVLKLAEDNNLFVLAVKEIFDEIYPQLRKLEFLHSFSATIKTNPSEELQKAYSILADYVHTKKIIPIELKQRIKVRLEVKKILNN